MQLSIVIPRYKESAEDLLPLLSSIRMQTAVDLSEVEVIISNDNPDDPIYPFALGLDLKVVNAIKNGGPGVARQKGLDQATKEYVMFCDADDSLHNVGVLSAFENEFKLYPECDYMQSQWLEELKVGDEFKYITHSLENTWMHGKVFRRDLLQTARFHDDLRVHEDSYYLTLIADSAKNRRQLNIISYVWRWREDSITRADNQLYEFKDFPNFIKAIGLSNLELMKRKSALLEYHVIQNLIYCYFMLMKDKWFAQPRYRTESIDALRESMLPFWEIYESADRGYVNKIYNEERAKIFSDEMEKYTLEAFAVALKEGVI